jgi:hypothetical protein
VNAATKYSLVIALSGERAEQRRRSRTAEFGKIRNIRDRAAVDGEGFWSMRTKSDSCSGRIGLRWTVDLPNLKRRTAGTVPENEPQVSTQCEVDDLT